MATITVTIDKATFDRITVELEQIGAKVPQVLAAAANDAAKSLKIKVSELIRAKVNIKKRDIDKFVTIDRANREHIAAGVRLSESARIPLKYFDAKQTAEGVTYQINRDEPRKLLPHAFGPKIKKLNGQVMLREGKQRLPLRDPAPRGPSPWGVFVENKLDEPAQAAAAEILQKAIEHRVNFELLKAKGQA